MTEYETTMTPEMQAGLEKYLAGRADQRNKEAMVMYGNLTERERALVGEAAVMAYVQGAMAHANGREVQVPKTSEILTTVLIECRNMADIYPTLAALDPAYESEEEGDD